MDKLDKYLIINIFNYLQPNDIFKILLIDKYYYDIYLLYLKIISKKKNKNLLLENHYMIFKCGDLLGKYYDYDQLQSYCICNDKCYDCLGCFMSRNINKSCTICRLNSEKYNNFIKNTTIKLNQIDNIKNLSIYGKKNLDLLKYN